MPTVSSGPLYRLLGPPDLRTPEQTVALGPKQALVLAGLLFRAGEVVAAGTLADYVWGTDLPANPASRLRTLVAELRRTLGGVAPGAIVTRAPGYLIEVSPGQCDVDVFHTALTAARTVTAPETALAHYDEALALWRGPALDGLYSLAAQADAARLDELHACVQEERAEVMLALGRHHTLLPELTALTATRPDRERLHAQFMLALFRCGRTEDALRVYRALRTRLAAESGLEPSPEVRRLHKDILSADPALTVVAPRPARRLSGLPPATGVFAGRDELLTALDGIDGGLVAITGAAGTGKTALAVRWAHRLADDYPDGQLLVNLRGFDPEPTDDDHTPTVLGGLGVPPIEIPDEPEARRALLHEVTHDRRLIIVLDNATDAAQIRPLLPGEPRCLVLVTSRDRLSGLVAIDGARRVALDSLDATAAVTVLTHVIGADRVHAEPGAAAALADLCGGLPLALRIAAAQLADRPRRTIADHVAELATDRIGRLRIRGDRSADLRAALDLSYASTPEPARRLFRLAAFVNAPAGISVDTAAAITGTGHADAEALLDDLAARHLLEPAADGLHVYHDLVREYGHRLATADPERDTMVTALLDHLLHRTLATVGGSHRVPPLPPPARPLPPLTAEQAERRLAAELPNLVAAVHYAGAAGHGETAWRLADALFVPMTGRTAASTRLAVAETGLAAALKDGDPLGEAAMRHALGVVKQRIGDLTAAGTEHTRALSAYRAAGHRRGESLSLQGLAAVRHMEGDLTTAIGLAREALAVDRDTGDTESQIEGLNNLAMTRAQIGDLDEALTDLAGALALARGRGDRHAEAQVLTNIAYAHSMRADLPEAVAILEESAGLYRELGRLDEEINVWCGLGSVHYEAGAHDKARAYFQAVLDEASRLGDLRLTVLAGCGLARAACAVGDLGAAAGHLDVAAEHLGDARFGYGRYLLAAIRARIALERGELDEALERASTALRLSRGGQHESVALGLLAEVHLCRGDVERCIDDAGAALTGHLRAGRRLEQARTLLILGRAHSRRADHSAAEARWSEAFRLLTGTGFPEIAEAWGLLASGGR
ncbi:AfsR/SARP family transcriptional regulator [Phytomonospora endophytica]|uniref:DNA-binding SARP family transcriptional activator/tetratricopeptide (TPR) repeat protein n=1 Tax=Phytomonospora endophytica TaxID=714109 RepID=A0A841FE93_9ACTN|nr:BTAD domain-containing putative transcriptional regulator [Phytomonospora endophytica]MBB6034586.1 DNA-binding SARP family transcriptional activator/tetratricopeptide (TPR) repeat protein [Phytomonospora endophytica]